MLESLSVYSPNRALTQDVRRTQDQHLAHRKGRRLRAVSTLASEAQHDLCVAREADRGGERDGLRRTEQVTGLNEDDVE